MSCSLKVLKELYISAPRSGVSVYAGGQAYTRDQGEELIETVSFEARNTGPRPFPMMAYYNPEIYTRISPDNGKTWETSGEKMRQPMNHVEGERFHSIDYFRDPQNENLVCFFGTSLIKAELAHKESFSDAGCTGRTRRIFYKLSHDYGRHWSVPRQVVCRGGGYSPARWGPGISYKKAGGLYGVGPVLKTPEGKILQTAVVQLFDGTLYQSVLLEGQWINDDTELSWDFSDYISVPPDKSSQGCCEPSPAVLDNGDIFISLRCSGDRTGRKFPSLKFWVVSRDGGRTFSEPKPLTYDDGSFVWSPSSMAKIIRSSVDKKYYWIGNILNEPSYGSYPRFPLCVAELLPEKGRLVRKSIAVIDTMSEGQEIDDGGRGGRRYTNFGLYEDRFTGELVLTLPEQPKIGWKDFTSDCYRYRIAIGK